jgi:hypothetical protein
MPLRDSLCSYSTLIRQHPLLLSQQVHARHRPNSLRLARRVIALRGEGIDFLSSDQKNADHGGVFRRRGPDLSHRNNPVRSLEEWPVRRAPRATAMVSNEFGTINGGASHAGQPITKVNVRSIEVTHSADYNPCR